MKCEICHKALRGAWRIGQTSVCNRCDRDIDRKFNQEQAVAIVKASMRACNQCASPLTPSRYFNCEECV